MDYQLPDVSELSLMAKRTDNASLSEPQPDVESIDQPVRVKDFETLRIGV